MKRFFSTIVLAATFAALTHAQTTYKEWMDVAERDMQSGKYSTAIGAYTKAIQASPANSEAFMQRAIAKAKNGDDEGAAIDFTNVIRVQPNNTKAYSLRSDTKARRGDFTAALFDINQALKTSPREMTYLEQRSKISEKMGVFAQAQADLDEIKRIKAEDAGAAKAISEPIAAVQPATAVLEVSSSRRQKSEPQSGREGSNEDDEVVIVKTKGAKVETRKEQKKADLKVEEKSANNFNEPEVIVQRETQKPKKEEKPKKEPKAELPKPVIAKIEPKVEVPAIKVEPKVEPVVVKIEPKVEPIIVKVEPVIVKAEPKAEPVIVKMEPVIAKAEPKAATSAPKDDAEIIIVDGVRQFKNGTILGSVELQPTGGASLQKQVEGGQPKGDFRGNAQTSAKESQAVTKPKSPKSEKVQDNPKTLSAVFTPTPAKNAASTLTNAAIAARPSTENNTKANEQLSSKPVAPRAPAADIQRSLFLEARRMAHDSNHKGAVEQLTKLIEQDPSNVASFLNRGISKSALEDFEGAIADFDAAAKIAPNMPEVYYNRANVFFDTKRYIEAIAGYTDALGKDKNYTQAYLNRALAKRATGGAYDPCADWKAAATLGSEKAKKMLDFFCDDLNNDTAVGSRQ